MEEYKEEFQGIPRAARAILVQLEKKKNKSLSSSSPSSQIQKDSNSFQPKNRTRKSIKKREYFEKKKLKSKMLKNQESVKESTNSHLKDPITFGSVVQEPPKLTALPRLVFKDKVGRKQKLKSCSPFQQIQLETSRLEAIEAYRKLKKDKQLK